MSVIKFIEKYKKEKITLFTTPSHNQGEVIAPESLKLLGKKFFECDYSELDGFDNLASPSGIIKLAQDRVAEINKACSAFFLTNGSTSGIIAAMLAVLNRGDKVLIARNCHRAVYNGLVLSGAVPAWIMPSFNEEWGIYETVNLLSLNDILSKNPDIKAFIITNPTYEGVMSDIRRISEICKKYNVILIVDEAHGALWNYYRPIGTPSVIQGADIVIQSLHKTAGALNPSALLLTGSNIVNPDKIRQALNLITTSSPSYPLLLNIEATVNLLHSHEGRNLISDLSKNITRMTRTLKKYPNINIYERNNDYTKILVKITNMSGIEIADILYNKYGIECEYANEKSILFITGIGTTKSKLKKLENALIKTARSNIKIFGFKEPPALNINVPPRVRYTPSLVWGKPSKEIDIKYSVSRVVMELIADYPPGIPILIPGEVIKKEHIRYLSDRKKIRVLM